MRGPGLQLGVGGHVVGFGGVASLTRPPFVCPLAQGDHERYTKVGATCKHFAAYSLEQWEGVSRFAFDARLDPRCVGGLGLDWGWGLGPEVACG